MGRSSAVAANLGAAAKRKPLSLKLERKNSPKKASLKITFNCEKENQHNINAAQRLVNDDIIKDKTVVLCAKESEERMALRRRVEEAVATHLAQRAPSVLLALPQTKNISVDKDCFKDDILCIDKVSHGSNTPKPPKGRGLVAMLAMLLVATMAIWSGVRVALLKPDTVIVVYQPYMTALAAVFPHDLLSRATQPMHYLQECFSLDLSEEVLSVEGLEKPSDDCNKYGVDDLDVVEISRGDEVDDVEAEPVGTSEENQEMITLELVEMEDIALDAGASLDTSDEVKLEASLSSGVVLALAPPHAGRAQMILRKAFDVLTPLKRVIANIQEKLVHVIGGIRKFFALKGK